MKSGPANEDVTKKAVIDAVQRNFAGSDVYSAYRLRTTGTSSVLMWSTILRTRTSIVAFPLVAVALTVRLPNWRARNMATRVIGKGTTSGLWMEVSREEVYQVLCKA
ncbi:hypothetical protein N7533_011581 [Penicillium manginii]|uniref:uncharacterized protein n=1 Tax=Penicillium manginii TaxID=203109 RepID=UPI002547899A|nr:uncharacterized protein N7533_011581 [Penicillium manginii]KAJ5742172.1 hypothetical protein N7533_011581 [Penicillium manginii]